MVVSLHQPRRSIMSFRPNTARSKRFRGQYRIRNWPQYDAGLKQRSNLTLWLDEAAISAWRAPTDHTRGLSSCRAWPRSGPCRPASRGHVRRLQPDGKRLGSQDPIHASGRRGAGAWSFSGSLWSPRCPSARGDAHRNRLGDPDHTVEHLSPKRNLARLARHTPGPQPRPNQRLVAPDRGSPVPDAVLGPEAGRAVGIELERHGSVTGLVKAAHRLSDCDASAQLHAPTPNWRRAVLAPRYPREQSPAEMDRTDRERSGVCRRSKHDLRYVE